MRTKRWTDTENDFLISMLDKPIDFIWECFQNKYRSKFEGFETNRSEEAILRRIRRVKELGDIQPSSCIESDNDVATSPKPIIDPTETGWKKLFAIQKKYASEEEASYPTTSSKDRMILSLSDLHLPFTPIDRIKSVLSKHKNELSSSPQSLIVLNGDILDQYAASNFGKYKKVAIIDEYEAALSLIEICLSYVENVYLTRGNHEKRLNRMVREGVNEDAANILGIDLLARLANGEEVDRFGLCKGLRENFKDRVHYQYKEPWYIRIGKTIFAHPSEFQSGPGGSVNRVTEYFRSRYSRDDFDCVVMAHTHSQYKGIVGNRLLIEQGAMCGRLDYEHQDNLKFKHSQNGYAIIYQDMDGNTNYNDSNFIYLGSMLPKKKKILN